MRGRTLRRLILPDEFAAPGFVIEIPPFPGKLPLQQSAGQPWIPIPPRLVEPGLQPLLMLLPLHAPPSLDSSLLEVREVGQDEFAEHDAVPPIQLRPPEPGQPRHRHVSTQSFQVIPQSQIIPLVGQQLLDGAFYPLAAFRHARG